MTTIPAPAEPMPSAADRHYRRLMMLCHAALVLLFGIALLLPEAGGDFFVSESGPIEIFSVAAYLVVVVSLCREGGGAFVRHNLHLLLIPVLMCLREMDFHSRFTTMSITKLDFYLSPGVPLFEKAYGVAVFALVIWAGVRLLGGSKAYLADLHRGKVYAVALLGAALLAAFSKTIDGIGRKFSQIGINLTQEADTLFGVAEEVMELGIPLFFLIAVFAYFPSRATVNAARP